MKRSLLLLCLVLHCFTSMGMQSPIQELQNSLNSLGEALKNLVQELVSPINIPTLMMQVKNELATVKDEGKDRNSRSDAAYQVVDLIKKIITKAKKENLSDTREFKDTRANLMKEVEAIYGLLLAQKLFLSPNVTDDMRKLLKEDHNIQWVVTKYLIPIIMNAENNNKDLEVWQDPHSSYFNLLTNIEMALSGAQDWGVANAPEFEKYKPVLKEYTENLKRYQVKIQEQYTLNEADIDSLNSLYEKFGLTAEGLD